jgi:hypothetical protein
MDLLFTALVWELPYIVIGVDGACVGSARSVQPADGLEAGRPATPRLDGFARRGDAAALRGRRPSLTIGPSVQPGSITGAVRVSDHCAPSAELLYWPMRRIATRRSSWPLRGLIGWRSR